MRSNNDHLVSYRNDREKVKDSFAPKNQPKHYSERDSLQSHPPRSAEQQDKNQRRQNPSSSFITTRDSIE